MTTADIPQHIRTHAEFLVSRGADLQRRSQHITQHLGRFECIYRRRDRMMGDIVARTSIARQIKQLRRRLAALGIDAQQAFAEFRDPGMFAFCDGGGATAADFLD